MDARATYTPSGRTNSAALLPFALALFGVAGLTAVAFALATAHECYRVVALWSLPALALPVIGRVAVSQSHCRSPRLAAALVASAGLVAVAGSFHVDQCRRWGVAWHRLDRLPGYVVFRMETDSWRMVGKAAVIVPLNAAGNPRVVPHFGHALTPNAHWLELAVLSLLAVVVPALATAKRARRPYSERVRGWLRPETLDLTPEAAGSLRAALAEGGLAEWAEFECETDSRKDEATALTVWFSPRLAGDAGPVPEIYLGLGGATPVLLSPEEVAALTAVLPQLQDWATAPLEARPVPSASIPGRPES